MQPAYDLAAFVAACDSQTSVWVTGQALADAAKLNLHTRGDILKFIGNGGLEAPRHANTAPWRNNPDKTNIDVDSYDFHSGTTHCYIAFYYSPKTGKWTLKSFKLNDKPGQRFTQLGDSLRKFLASTNK